MVDIIEDAEVIETIKEKDQINLHDPEYFINRELKYA